MKDFDSRTYSINDFVEWHGNQQLELSPKFQRRNVWSPNARSYLMDTIIRGKPIPKLFIRQKISATTKRSVREVVDGQQRLRTILSFISDGFFIKRIHNEEHGGKYYSQLDEETQTGILNYELSVDLLVNMSDADVLDVFGRLNSYAVILNEQEKINAQHFGPFKILADTISRDYYTFWTTNKILTEAQVLRMDEVSLVADLLIAMTAGIKPKKQIRSFYVKYENDFPFEEHLLDDRFHKTMAVIAGIFGDTLKTSQFRRTHLFYSLFTAVYHLEFGLPSLQKERRPLNTSDYPRVLSSLGEIDTIFSAATENSGQLTKVQARFLEDSRRATTDAPVRTRRTEFIVDLMLVR